MYTLPSPCRLRNLPCPGGAAPFSNRVVLGVARMRGSIRVNMFRFSVFSSKRHAKRGRRRLPGEGARAHATSNPVHVRSACPSPNQKHHLRRRRPGRRHIVWTPKPMRLLGTRQRRTISPRCKTGPWVWGLEWCVKGLRGRIDHAARGAREGLRIPSTSPSADACTGVPRS